MGQSQQTRDNQVIDVRSDKSMNTKLNNLLLDSKKAIDENLRKNDFGQLIYEQGEGHVVIRVGDMSWGLAIPKDRLSEFAKDNSLSCLEFMSCIPGSVGGGIRMNSGCFDREFKDVLISLQTIDYSGRVKTVPANKINFEYRNVDLPKDIIFLPSLRYFNDIFSSKFLKYFSPLIHCNSQKINVFNTWYFYWILKS